MNKSPWPSSACIAALTCIVLSYTLSYILGTTHITRTVTDALNDIDATCHMRERYAPGVGLEPTTKGLTVLCATTAPPRNIELR